MSCADRDPILGNPLDSGEELLQGLREGLIHDVHEKFDLARQLEVKTGLVYVAETPVATEHEDMQGVMLTEDGVKPFKTDEKPRLWLYVPSLIVDLVIIEDISAVGSEKVSLAPNGIHPHLSLEEALEEVEHDLAAADPTEQERLTVVGPKRPVSDAMKLTILGEKITRWELTPLGDQA